MLDYQKLEKKLKKEIKEESKKEKENIRMGKIVEGVRAVSKIIYAPLKRLRYYLDKRQWVPYHIKEREHWTNSDWENEALGLSDNQTLKGLYVHSLLNLELAYKDLNKFKGEERNKFKDAIIERVDRLIYTIEQSRKNGQSTDIVFEYKKLTDIEIEAIGLGNKLVRFTKKHKKNDLEGRVTAATVLIFGLIFGIFFLSNNITGNAVLNLTQSYSNLIGVVLILIGLIIGFFWFISKK